jgi:hypothetical protein
MNRQTPAPRNPRQVWIGLSIVLVLGMLLIWDKTQDGWDRRQWLIGGGIVLWAIGPATLGGLVGARFFCRSRVLQTAQRGAAGCAVGAALLAAIVTVMIVQPDTTVQYRPGASRFPFASDWGLLIGIQVMMGSLLAGYFAGHASYLHARRWGNGQDTHP